MRTRQDGGNRYDQLLGGDGNLISELNDLSLDLVLRAARAARARAGSTHASFDVLAQQPARGTREPGRQRQPDRDDRRTSRSGRRSTACRRRSRRRALAARDSVPSAATCNFERLTSDAFNVNPVTRRDLAAPPARAGRRARSPRAACSRRPAFDVGAGSRCGSPARCASAARAMTAQARRTARSSNGQPLWPDDSLTTSSVTFRAAAVVDAGRSVDAARRRSAAASARRT